MGIVLLRCFLFINLVSDSMPRGLYLLRVGLPGQPPPHLALFCLPGPLARIGRSRGYLGRGLCPGGASALIKPIVATAGDRVAISDAGVAVNGHLLVNSAPLSRDSQGRSVPATPLRSFRMPPGTFLAVSSFTPRSWDGRYWGPLPVSLIGGPARLLFPLGPTAPVTGFVPPYPRNGRR